MGGQQPRRKLYSAPLKVSEIFCLANHKSVLYNVKYTMQRFLVTDRVKCMYGDFFRERYWPGQCTAVGLDEGMRSGEREEYGRGQ